MNLSTPIIPESVTVHLGAPNVSAADATVSFADYIANVASSEIYPTWPQNALIANILAQTSYTLNRVYTEFYRARGYEFDITNSTAFDQSYVNGRQIFDNINDIVGEYFNSYIRRQGSVEPLAATYCDGVNVSCNGLSQWGSVDLANRGLSPIEILRYYFGEDIEIVSNVPIENVVGSAPEIPLRIGQSNDNTRTVQIRLNRISENYPGIPKISPPDGVFSFDTEEAVRTFQTTFGLTPDGVVGNATWYKILQVYNAVKRLNEVTSEGVTFDEVTQQYPDVLRTGDTGVGVANLQYYLNYLSLYYDTIPPVIIDGIFGSGTEAALRSLQETFGLPVTGEADEDTWEAMYNNYLGFIETIPLQYTEGVTVPYPGVVLRVGADSDEVRLLQEYLNYIAQYYPEIPTVTPTGYFGTRTLEAVLAFQREFGFTENGFVEASLWFAITDVYEDLFRGNNLGEGQYPGYTVGE